MNKRLIAFLSVLLLSVSLTVIPANSAVKAGEICAKSGVTSVASGKKFTCIKSGKKLAWNKGVIISQNNSTLPTNKSSSEFVFESICQHDPNVPSEWKAVELAALSNVGCAHPYRYVLGSTNFGEPKSKLSTESDLQPISACKVSDTKGRPYRYADFPRSASIYTPAISANIQVVPVQFSDLTASTNPESDYGAYFKYVTDYLVNTSDVPISPKTNIYPSYIQLGKKVDFYNSNGQNLADEHGAVDIFISDVLSAISGKIDLSKTDQLVIVPPPSAKSNQIKFHMNFYRNLTNQIGRVLSIYLYGSISTDQTQDRYYGFDPFIYVHEQLFHQMGLDDEYGTWGEAGTASLGLNPTLEQIGMGYWGNMSSANLELLVWDKWKVGFIADSQVLCLNPQISSTNWLRPSTIKGSFTKMAVIPISSSKAIVIESERSTGYNFKLPTTLNGLLVYQVDQELINGGSNNKFGLGVHLLLPSNRKTEQFTHGFLYGDARLIKGDYIDIAGLRITNIESGTFGDVVKVEKVS